ncbi:MAG: PHP domain-containing protein [Halieaceae bacterium]|nr:PHP domain-containing protein [Halieaceae bacterium]
MLIDFHTHTAASDGALSPRELLALARERGLGMLAITDHDTVAGYLAVERGGAVAGEDGEYTCNRAGLRLIPGIEFSCRWSATTIHILGLGMDCDHPAMVEGLALLNTARIERGRKIAQRLEALGFEGALEGALAEAGESQLGRPHFSAWMLARGHVADHNQAFDKYLGQGKTGDVKAFWPELAAVVSWIVAAGGVAVIAHPLKYRFTRMKLRRLVVDFMAAGGAAIEIASGYQTADQDAQLRRLAREFDLEVSVGSDFHRDGPYSPLPGVELPRLDGLRGVWERWLPLPLAAAGGELS